MISVSLRLCGTSAGGIPAVRGSRSEDPFAGTTVRPARAGTAARRAVPVADADASGAGESSEVGKSSGTTGADVRVGPQPRGLRARQSRRGSGRRALDMSTRCRRGDLGSTCRCKGEKSRSGLGYGQPGRRARVRDTATPLPRHPEPTKAAGARPVGLGTADRPAARTRSPRRAGFRCRTCDRRARCNEKDSAN